MKRGFKLTNKGIKLVPATVNDLMEFHRLTGGLILHGMDFSAEAARLNARTDSALDEANKLLELSESASTNDIEIYIKDHPPTALAIAFLTQVASARRGKKSADIRHSKEGGSRDKQNQICEIWASGKYTSRDICADEEYAALGMSRKAARNALIGTPKPK